MSSEALERAPHERDYLERTIATVRNHRDAENCWPSWANIFADAIEHLWAEVARLEQERDEASALSVDDAGMRIAAEAERDRACAALAVAREREQRAAEALRLIDLKTGWPCNHERWREVARIARAALVDEPAAATLAEPEGSVEEAHHRATVEARVATPPGSASAAADEPGETP